MSSKITNIILLILILAAFVGGTWAYPQLPERVASHWNTAGEVNGSMGRFLGVFLLPFIMAFLWFLYGIIPRVDPLKKNIAGFRKAYNAFWAFIMAFFLYVFVLTLAWNLGHRFDMTLAILPAVGVLFYVIGMVIEKSKRNWFMGIRTPWTLSSDVVWEKTHTLGGLLFKLVALVTLASLFFSPSVAILVIIVSALGVSLITVVYSYVVYRALKK